MLAGIVAPILNRKNPDVGNEAVPFEMRLTRVGANGFSGESRDEGEFAVPGVAEIHGQRDGLTIRFVKQIPNMLAREAGQYISYAAWVRKHYGEEGIADPMPYDIFYQGVWRPDTARFAGTWTIAETTITLKDGRSLSTGAGKGTWIMERCPDGSRMVLKERPDAPVERERITAPFPTEETPADADESNLVHV